MSTVIALILGVLILGISLLTFWNDRKSGKRFGVVEKRVTVVEEKVGQQGQELRELKTVVDMTEDSIKRFKRAKQATKQIGKSQREPRGFPQRAHK